MVPLNYGVCSLWVWLDQWLVKVSQLGKLVSMSLWVELDLFSTEYNEVSSDVCELLWAPSLLMFMVVFLFAGELSWCDLH